MTFCLRGSMRVVTSASTPSCMPACKAWPSQKFPSLGISGFRALLQAGPQQEVLCWLASVHFILHGPADTKSADTKVLVQYAYISFLKPSRSEAIATAIYLTYGLPSQVTPSLCFAGIVAR